MTQLELDSGLVGDLDLDLDKGDLINDKEEKEGNIYLYVCMYVALYNNLGGIH